LTIFETKSMKVLKEGEEVIYTKQTF